MNKPDNLPNAFETDRLEARLLTREDAPALLKTQQASEDILFQWYGGGIAKKDQTLETITDFITDCANEFEARVFLHFGVFEKGSGDLLGCASLHTIGWNVPKGRIGYWMRPDKSGKGYATEIANALTRYAFEFCKFERLEIRAEVNNPASGKVADKLNYKYLCVFEKVKRGQDGRLWDLEIYVRHNLKDLPSLNFKAKQ